tara:strand:+ start:180 stop:1973 length:1794 start_codon:yes stop_codon:yes gene_type:complete
MATTIQIKRGTGSAVPSGLADGELAINLDNGQLYFGSGSTSVNDFTFGSLNATSLNVTSITSSIVTSSIVLSEGSNTFGDTITDTQTFNGHITASGNISASGIGTFNRLDVAEYIYHEDDNTYIRFLPDRIIAVAGNNSVLDLRPGTSVKFGHTSEPTIIQGSTLTLTGDVTASGNISASGIIASLNITSLNITSGSLLSSIDTISVTTGSLLSSIDTLSVTTGSLLSSIDAISATTGSLLNSVDTISATTSSLLNSVDALSIVTGSYALTSSLNNALSSIAATTSSLLNSVDAISATTSSLLSSIDTISVTTGSLLNSVDAISATTSSLLSSIDTISVTTGSLLNSVDAISATTSSLLNSVDSLSIVTGSYAITGSDVSFAALTVSGDITANGDIVGDNVTDITNMRHISANRLIANVAQTVGTTQVVLADGSLSISAGGPTSLTANISGSILNNVNQNIYNTSSIAIANTNGAYGDIVKFGGTTTTAGGLYYLNSIGTWELTAANSLLQGASASLAVAVGTNSTIDGMCLRGFVNPFQDPSDAPIGGQVFMSDNANGRITGSAPSDTGDIVRVVGYRYGVDLVYFNPSNDFIVHA